MTQNSRVVSKLMIDGVPAKNTFTYRGVRFSRDDSLRGYWGHYSTIFRFNGAKIRTSTRLSLLKNIDLMLDADQNIYKQY